MFCANPSLGLCSCSPPCKPPRLGTNQRQPNSRPASAVRPHVCLTHPLLEDSLDGSTMFWKYDVCLDMTGPPSSVFGQSGCSGSSRGTPAPKRLLLSLEQISRYLALTPLDEISRCTCTRGYQPSLQRPIAPAYAFRTLEPWKGGWGAGAGRIVFRTRAVGSGMAAGR